ncbi:hypothetical protein C8J57DRAFT_1532378 [Mycena rebaudengoi]|nr:hypothetical protein C8J57DRAFT_1532378 [Mycena rebaudengoi]
MFEGPRASIPLPPPPLLISWWNYNALSSPSSHSPSRRVPNRSLFAPEHRAVPRGAESNGLKTRAGLGALFRRIAASSALAHGQCPLIFGR